MTVGGLGLPADVGRTADRLRPGAIRLRVPVLGDAIQVGTALHLPTATIEVSRTPSAVQVRRTDGRALQAHIITRSGDGAETRTEVFAEPVRSLRLDRDRGAGRWVVAATCAAAVRQDADVAQFVTTVLAFSASKQSANSVGQRRRGVQRAAD